MVTHPSNNLVVQNQESILQTVDYKSEALTTTPPSHLVVTRPSVEQLHWLRPLHHATTTFTLPHQYTQQAEYGYHGEDNI